MRRAFSIACYVVSGFVLYGLCLVAFAAFVPRSGKLLTIGVGAAGALVVLGVGLVLSRYESWRRDAGAVFVTGASIALIVVLNLLWMLYAAPPALRELFPPDLLTQFGDWLIGSACIGGLMASGLALLFTHKNHPGQSSG